MQAHDRLTANVCMCGCVCCLSCVTRLLHVLGFAWHLQAVSNSWQVGLTACCLHRMPLAGVLLIPQLPGVFTRQGSRLLQLWQCQVGACCRSIAAARGTLKQTPHLLAVHSRHRCCATASCC